MWTDSFVHLCYFPAATEDYEALVNDQVAFSVGDVVGTEICRLSTILLWNSMSHVMLF